jgi:DNA uptake protein and related DNA-binding proteins
MSNWLKNFFTFNKLERNGAIVLLFIIVLVLLSPFYLKIFNRKQKTDFASFHNEITAFENQRKQYNDSASQRRNTHDVDFNNVDRSEAERNLHPFPFNPNNLSSEKWRKIGLTDRQIRTIKNYEAKGGKFYKKEDLKKIYGLSEDEYLVLEPFITLPERENKQDENKIYNRIKPKLPPVVVEINTADSAELMRLNGIGASFSRRIVKYRNLLGGFSSKEQLLEVYGMDSARLLPILDNLTVDQQLIKKINLNTVTIKDLSKHPYLDYYVAKAIVNYRDKHGKYKSVEDLKNAKLIYIELFEKIKPYLVVE